MRGRREAILVAMLAVGSVLFYWIGAAVIALVTLRKGQQEGLYLLSWALLPAIAVAWFGGEIVPLLSLLGAAVAGATLRATVSWSWALASIVLFAVVVGLVLLGPARAYLDHLLAMFAEMMERFNAELRTPDRLPPPTALQLAGLLATMHVVVTVVSLIVARWWQAMLYNPGGFGEEFRQLRLPVWLALLLALPLVATRLSANTDPGWLAWAGVAMVPLAVAGIALVHGLVRQRGPGAGIWLFGFYVALLVLPVMRELVALAAALDSWLDFRGRAQRKPPLPPAQ